jgi:TolB-like protein
MKNDRRIHPMNIILNTIMVSLLISLTPSCSSTKIESSSYKKPLINVYIEPATPENISGDSIGIFNFNFLKEGENSRLSFSLAEYIQTELLKNNFIRIVETTECGYKNADHAIDIGRQEGYDLIFLGEVDKYFQGMSSSDSEVSITVKLIETRSAATLWYMTGQMAAKQSSSSDFYIFQTDGKPATSPAILSQYILNGMVKKLCETRAP